MPSDSVVTFLDLAKEQRLLHPEDLETLFQQPDVPKAGVAILCDFLQNRGVLTKYQADKIRTGNGADLNFAGYPILGEVGDCPGGTAYQANRRGSAKPVILRRLRAEWFAPADNAAAFLHRAQLAQPIEQTHLIPVLDAGVHADETFIVTEAFDGKDLKQLVADIGPMPAVLAAEFGRQTARGLEAAHSRGVAHGDLRPDNILAGPLIPMSKTRADGTPRYRPAPTATVKVTELGLVPRRPPATSWTTPTEADREQAVYLPPERFVNEEFTGPGDVYMLGGSLFFLLTGRAPYAIAELSDLHERKTIGQPPALELIRPDAPQPLVQLVSEMLSTLPENRPSMSAVAERLEAIVRDGQKPPALTPLVPLAPATEGAEVNLVPANGEVPLTHGALASLSGVDLDNQNYTPNATPPGWPSAVPPPVFVPPAYMPQEWGAAGYENQPSTASNPSLNGRPPRKPREPFSRTKLYMWLLVGLALNAIAIGIWVFMFSSSSDDSDPTPSPNTQPVKVKSKKPKSS